MEQPPNRGFLLEPIVKDKDGVFGSSLSFVARGVEVQPDGNWTPFLPPEEYQNRIFNGSIETNSCATFGTLNQVEMYIRRVFGKDPDYADRFLAKASGTTAQGNTPHKVLETLRKQGVVDEPQWPWTSDIVSWAQYFAEIPKNLLTLALAWPLEYFLWHDYCPTDPNSIRSALKYSPVAVSVLELIDENGLYYKPDGLRDTHWVVCVAMKPNGNYIIFDTYAPFIKEFKAGYKFEVAKVITINRQIKVESFWQKFLAWLFATYAPIPTPAPSALPTPVPAVASKIETWALAIQHEEGGLPQHPNMKNNNPGNLKYTSYTASLGAKKGILASDGGTFCYFDTYEHGFKALCDMLRDACRGNLLNYKPTTTLRAFTQTYANPPAAHHYAENVAKVLGVSADIVIEKLL